MTLMLRVVAIAIAVFALIDPAFAIRRVTPLAVEVLLPPASDPGHAAAAAVARRIDAELTDAIATNSPEPARARVLLGGALPQDLSVPVFIVQPEEPGRVTITSVRAGEPIVSGQAVKIEAGLRAAGVSGRTSLITLRDRGVIVGRAERSWTSADEEHRVRFEYAAPGIGTLPLTLQIDTPGADPVSADVSAVVSRRVLRVLVYEPRPSWGAAFIRRALEGQPQFTVAALSRSAPRLATRLRTTAASLGLVDAGDFDVMIVGAPEQLSAPELDVLDRFASRRGGAILLVPDTRLSPAVQQELDLPRMEERLLDTPTRVHAGGGRSLRASELLLPAVSRPADAPLATVTLEGRERAAILAAPRGDGTVVLSGLLDAWRYRGAAAEGFWRGLVAHLALSAPQPLTVRAEPMQGRPGDRIRITASWRSDLIEAGDQVRVPATSASLRDSQGRTDRLRLWPGERAGTYEAWLDAPAAGIYTVTADGAGASAEMQLRVTDDVMHAKGWGPPLDSVAALTGGTVARSIPELREQLQRLPGAEIQSSVFPMRSPWWIVPFAGCLCAEWLLRRKRGLR